MDLRTFLSVLLVYRSNFQVLHWKASGCHFDKVHSMAATYYDKLLDDADIVAEMTMRLDQDPVNYKEAYDTLEEADGSYLVIESTKDYCFKEFVEHTDKMFSDILKCLDELLDSGEIQERRNTGIRATLEGMYEQYDLEYRYLNKRRGAGHDDSHEDDHETSPDIEDDEDFDIGTDDEEE